MRNNSNIHSYDNVEKIQCNLDKEGFEKYCELKINSTKGDVNFIKKNLFHGALINVCEIGTGNGKLLFQLEREGMINNALGYEVSKSRCDFAAKLKEYMKCSKTIIRNQNFIEDVNNVDCYDLIIAVDIVLQIISPLYDNAEKDFFQWVDDHLTKEGYLFLELEDHSEKAYQIEQSGQITSWEEFPDGDVFQYGLYSMYQDNDGNIVDKKTFLNRKTMEKEQFQNVIKSYSEKEIIEKLSQFGLTGEIYQYYDEYDSTPENQKKKIYRVVAKKK